MTPKHSHETNGSGKAQQALQIDVLTLFPGLFQPFLAEGLLGKAVEAGRVRVNLVNYRQWGVGKHRQVDDVPYGGGAGMVLKPEPLFAAVRQREAEYAQAGQTPWRILLTPQGRPFDQAKARELAGSPQPLLFICGRYEGFDERIRQALADEELSGGDYVVLGGEVVAMVVMEAVIRLLPGVLGNPDSVLEESFAQGGLEYPQYTRPPVFEGMAVPDVLLSGDHKAIARWRAEQSVTRTQAKRPDLPAPKL